MEQANVEYQRDKVDRNPILTLANEPFKRSAVQKLLGVNPNTWQMLEERAVIPKSGTYFDCCQAILKYYQKAEGLKLEAAKLKAEAQEGKRNYRNADTESGLPRIQEAAIISKIRLDKAKEESIHLDNLAKKDTFIDRNEQYELLSPILSTIANELKAIVAENPETATAIDKCFSNLHRFGKIICEQVELDGTEYVKKQMTMEVNLEEIIEQGLDL